VHLPGHPGAPPVSIITAVRHIMADLGFGSAETRTGRLLALGDAGSWDRIRLCEAGLAPEQVCRVLCWT
jgi:hypothetical protein